MKMISSHECGNGLIKSVRKLLSGPGFVVALLLSWFLAGCGPISKQSQAPVTGGSPDFSLSVSPSSLTVAQGLSGSNTITVAPQSGFTGSVTLAASGLPTGVTASFDTNPSASTRTLTLMASATATTGMSAVTITGTSGALSHTTTISLTVSATATPDFSLSASPSSLTIAQGSNGSSTITVAPHNGFAGSVTLATSGLPTGVTASFDTNPSASTRTLTLMASATATTGMSTVTITGTSGALSHTTTISLTVSATATPDFSLSASPSSLTVAQGSKGSSTITVAPHNGFTGSVTLAASGLPTGVTASFDTNPSASTRTLTLMASATATTGMSTLTITGTSGALSHTTTISLTVSATATPDFSLSASPSSLTVAQGSKGSSTITVAPHNGFTGSVTLAASGLPTGVTASFGTTPTASTSTLTLMAGASATTGTSTVTITGTSGALSHTTTVALTVNASVLTLIARPTMLSFNYQIGSTVPGAQSISVTSSPSSLSFTTATSGGTWLSAGPMNGTTPGTVNVTVNPAGLTAGTYNGTVTIASAGATGSPQTVQVTLSVSATSTANHYEYVFTDGTLYVYDLDAAGFPLVKSKSIPTSSGTRGAVACVGNGRLYVSFGGDGGPNGNGGLLAYDLVNDAVVWTQNYSHGIDSHAITPDCALIYMPDGELANSTTWHVVDANTGNEIGTIAGSDANNPHNTIVFNGHVYLGGRQSTVFQAANVSNNTVYFTSAHTGNSIRPFTLNAEETAAYITETNFLGFQQIDLNTGAVGFTVPVTGFSTSCSSNCPSTPSHGISMSPDERWLYVLDSINGYVHVFDIGGGVNVQPMQKFDVKLNHGLLNTESPCAYDCLGDGWLHHSFDGRYVLVGDSGDVIDTGIQSGYVNAPRVVGFLSQMANSRKEIEIDFQGGKVVAAMANRSSIGTGAK
jgi:hypothetical protein